MRGKILGFALILVFFGSVCCTAAAFTPTPSPSPSPSPSYWDRCRNHIRISAEGYPSSPQHYLLYSNEGFMMADGILHFMPLEEFVEQEQLEVIGRDQFLTMEITHDNYVDDFSCKTYLYQRTENGLAPLKSTDLPKGNLPKNTYLGQIDCMAGHQEEYYRFYCLFWLE